MDNSMEALKVRTIKNFFSFQIDKGSFGEDRYQPYRAIIYENIKEEIFLHMILKTELLSKKRSYDLKP